MGGIATIRHGALIGGVDAVIGISSLAYWDWHDDAHPEAPPQHADEDRHAGRPGRTARLRRPHARALGRTRIARRGDRQDRPDAGDDRARHGRQVVPSLEHAQRLFDAAGEPKRLLLGEGFGHAEDGLSPAFANKLVSVVHEIGGLGMVRVRLFAALREQADASRVEATGRTVGEVVDQLSERYGERFASIAAVGSYVVNGERASRDTVIAEGDEVALLPPVSGGG